MTKQHGDLTALRREYCGSDFSHGDLSACPIAQFRLWFKQAQEGRSDDASSMTLATASASGMPSARIVLLKHYDVNGFCWYTDYESQKGRELAENPQAELMFYWYGLERQVRIQGAVHKLSLEQADQYFSQRPRESQVSAYASYQSQPISSREALKGAVAQSNQKYLNQDVLRPERWGGYCLLPDKMEFWQGREGRLHDRLVYQRNNQDWLIQRLQP
jgi:pyridoxamine 5'-phosphate oxidase